MTHHLQEFHGKDKKWKTEPVKKSPLSGGSLFDGSYNLPTRRWYNVPLSPKKSKKKASTSEAQETAEYTNGYGDAGDDSAPLNFDTFVPTHDASLASAAPPHPPSVPGVDQYAQFYLPDPPGPLVSQDEAFTRALSAMYWGGYWTAVYHVSSAYFA